MKIILAGHGTFPEYLKKQINLVCGVQQPICVISEQPSNNQFREEIDACLEDPSTPVLAITDLPAGASTQYLAYKTKTHNITLVSGLSLHMVLELIKRVDSLNPSETERILEECRNHMTISSYERSPDQG